LNVFLTAILETGDVSIPVRIRNLSARGALIDGARLPSVGAKLRLLRGHFTATGAITWREKEQAGVKFDTKVQVESWVARVGHPGQQRVDSVLSAIRRSERVSDDLLGARSKSLDDISTTLDAVCERLAAMPNMTVELAEELVKLDVVAQDLRELATGGKS
jgi:hypothetical protein